MQFGDLQFLVEHGDNPMPKAEDLFEPTDKPKPKLTDKFRSDGTPRARHMKGMTGLDRKTGQNLIPDIHKVDPEANFKVETLRKKDTGMFVLDGDDLHQILDDFHISNLTPVESRQLGTTGISIFYNPSMKKYCIKK